MRVVLIGEAFEGSENLALAMLEASLAARGHDTVRVPLGPLTAIDETASAALRVGSGLIGLSINYQVSALTALAVGHRLRMAGYRGHLTAGGAFATLHAREVLRDCPLDSLILFDGERPLADLADHLERGVPVLGEISGLVLRSAEGVEPASPPRVWDDPFTVWATRPDALPEHLGVPCATLLGSRGCRNGCAYCCISALRASARGYAALAGRSGGLTGTRWRPVGELADEIACLRHERGARIFRFEDDCLLGRDAEQAQSYLSALRRELTARGADDIAVTLKLRPDSLDPTVVDELEQLGLIHAFVGIEALTGDTLRGLGRSCSAAACRAALRLLRERGIPAYFNALLIGPETTVDGLFADLDALERVEGAPFEIARLILYAHTPLFERLRRRDAVSGNYLHWRYGFRDSQIEGVARILERLPTRCTGSYGVPKRLADLDLNLAVARRFHPGAETASIAAEAARIREASNRDAVELVRELVRLARRHPSPAEQIAIAGELAAEVSARDGARFDRIAGLVDRLEGAASRAGHPRPRSFLRSGLAAAALSTQLVFVPVAAAPPDPLPADDVGPSLAQQGPPGEGSGEALEAAPGEGSGEALEAEPMPASDATTCETTVSREGARDALRDIAERTCDVYLCAYVVFKFDGRGRVVDISTNYSPYEEEMLSPAVRRCLLDALSSVCFEGWSDNAMRVSFVGPCD